MWTRMARSDSVRNYAIVKYSRGGCVFENQMFTRLDRD